MYKRQRRTIPLIEPVRSQIAALAPPEERTGLIWGPRHVRTDYAAWQRILADAGVPAVPLHAARATTASILTEAGVAPKVISEILGHAQVSTTQTHYVHGDDLVHRAALDELGRLLEG